MEAVSQVERSEEEPGPRKAALVHVQIQAQEKHPSDRAIIDASSKKGVGDKSEWTQALKYAEKNQSQIEGF